MALITEPRRQRLDVGQVLLAWAVTTSANTRTDLRGGVLSEQDLMRAAGFGPARRQAFLLGRTLVATLVDELFPATSGWSLGSRSCPRCGVRHSGVEITGVPAVASVSHAPGLVIVAAAASDRVSRLGVDVEPDAANATRSRDLERLLGRSAEPVLRRWTRVEAVLKADGRGLLVDPADVRVRAGLGRILDDAARYRVVDVAGPAGYLISLAWCGGGSSEAGSGQATE
jgi:4'-phosphopantetheinyl transferase